MDIMAILWFTFGLIILMAIGGFILIIAGKDILFAFKRFLNKQGCFVFIVNASKFASLYFLTPKENTFRIKGNIYATNPEKCLNIETKYITDVEKENIRRRLEKRQEDILKRIDWLKKKREKIIGIFNLEALEENQKSELLKNLAPIDASIARFTSKLNDIDKSENYYYKSKPCFFFIEGDPVPKDFFNFYSELDSKIIDNVAARAASSAANIAGQKSLNMWKWLIIAAAIAAALAAFFAFRNQTILNELAAKAGVVISI